MTDFCDFMNERAREIEKGLHNVHPDRQSWFNKTHRAPHVETVATEMARGQKSDPFVYKRTRSQLVNGLASVDDFYILFDKEVSSTQLSLALGRQEPVDIVVARNIKIPFN